MAGSSAERCPRFAATVSPGTRLVSTNVTSVTPTTSSSDTAMRRTRYRTSGWPARYPAGSLRGADGAALLGADGADIDRPDGVVRRARHRLRRDDVGGRLHQRDERAGRVEALLELLVERVPLGEVGDRGGRGGGLVDVGSRGGGPVGALPDQTAGCEG